MDVHIVVKGDTLWKIARQYGIPFEDLKRVNAHLANPDYIVPGMKIFLPKKKTAPLPSEKGKEKMPEKVKPQQVKPQQVKPSTPPAMEKPTKPKEPVPLPKVEPEFEMPKPPSVPRQPMPSLPVQPPPVMTPPAESVQPLPSIPPAVPTPPMAMPQFFQPIMPVPCGWMPIYDADCVPMPFPSFTQQMPAPMPTPAMPPQSMPSQVMPAKEMPTTPAKLGVKPPSIESAEEMDEFEESPIYPGRGPGVSPPYPVRGWELMESPTIPLESPEHMVYCPPEQGYVPQMVSPEYQNPSEMMMQPQQPFFFGYPCPPMPVHHCGCPHHGFYGFGPSEMQPNYMMPMQVSPMQMNPTQMNPMQMNPMHMNPMQMNPMHMQPFNPMDNYGCGC